ncbi:M23 family metallopeptidase [Pontibacter sp. G13]|uniref:M23 family metallopeptidase n=1 Tax=Pontibacter sp. G13 TaxID=3074898 RepID=UPI00288A152A|nr:M23 family metallopeptidase [Pontibacter sp. G13]WNJ20415.1 M23 family metallopeptidase [Pontibacter sp. G13]
MESLNQRLEELKNPASSSSDMRFAFAGVKKLTRLEFSHVPDIRPLPHQVAAGSMFGMRKHPILKKWMMHAGQDFGAPRGTPVYATADGIVNKANMDRGVGYGRYVSINHGENPVFEGTYETLYAHLSKLAVKPGQRVEKGQLIGYVGNTGRSTNPHLHYEVRVNGKAVNPQQYFALQSGDRGFLIAMHDQE